MLRWRCFVLLALGIPLSRGFLGPLGVTGAVNPPLPLGVSQVASKLSVNADASTLKEWQSNVEDEFKKAKKAIEESYPVPVTEDSFHKSARFLLKEAPQDQFRFFEQKTRNILDLVSDTTKKKRMVEVPVLLKDGLVLADPVRDADQLARKAESLMKELSLLSSKVQKQTTSLIDGSDRILETIAKAAGLLELKQVQAHEAQAAADYAAAKKISEDLRGAVAELVEKTAAIGLLLTESAKAVASMGPEAKFVRDRLHQLNAQFASQVDSSNGDAKTALRHLNRGLAVADQLDDDYRKGVFEVDETKTILKIVLGCRERLENFKRSLKQLQSERSAISNTVDDTRRAFEQGNVAALKRLIDRLDAERAKVALIADSGRDIVGELAVKKQALTTTLEKVTSATSQKIGQVLIQLVTKELTGLKSTLGGEVQMTQMMLAKAVDEASQLMEQRLKEHATAVADNEGWLQTAASSQKKLVAEAQTRQAESAAAKQAADQFKARLLEDISEVEKKVAAGESDWKTLNTTYSLDARGEAAAQLQLEAETAAEDASRAYAMLRSFAETFNKEASDILKKLTGPAEAAAELAERLKGHRTWLLALEKQLSGSDQEAVSNYGDTAGHRADEATALAAKSSAFSKAIESRVQDVNKAVQQTERAINSQKGSAEGGDSSSGSSSTSEDPKALQELMDRAKVKMADADKHLMQAKELTNKVEGLKATLRQDINALKAAFGAGSSGGSGESHKDLTSRQSKVLDLAATVHTRVDHMVSLAKELRMQLEAAGKTQQEALQAAAQLRLIRLKVFFLKKGSGGGAPSGGLCSLKELDVFLNRLSKEAQRHALDMEMLRVQDGGPAAQEDLVDGVLQQLSEVLSLAEGRLTTLLQIEILELEKRMLSTEGIARQLQKGNEKEAGKGQDGGLGASASAASLKANEQAVRHLGEKLHREALEVEGTAVRVRGALESLKELEASQTVNGVSGRQGVPTSGRALAAAADTPTVEELLQKATHLAARSEKAKEEISNILKRLDAFAGIADQKGDASTDVPTDDADKKGGGKGRQQQEQQPGDGSLVPLVPGRPPSSPNKSSEEESKRRSGGGLPPLYLAAGIAGGVLALLGVVALAVCLSRRCQKKKSGVEDEDGTGKGDLQQSGELPSLSPTLDFDQLPSVLPGLHGEVLPGSASGELGKVMTLQPEVVVLGDLEAGKVPTTNRQYFVDEHHLVAKELSSQRYPQLKALGYVVPSTPTVGVPTGSSVTVTEAVPPPPRMWESAYSGIGQDAAAALSAGVQQQQLAADSQTPPRQQQVQAEPQKQTPLQGQQKTQSRQSPQREQKKERSTSQRAIELRNLEAEIERELQTQSQNQLKKSPPSGARQA